jgi:uroporphyrinogen decarboxylase
MMTSKERVKRAFQHREPDQIPVGELAIHAPVTSEILNRDAITGEGGLVKRTQMEFIRAGRRDEFVARHQSDTLELHRLLGLDLIIAELALPRQNKIAFKDIDENSWTAVDEAAGTWSKYLFAREPDIVCESDSSLKEGGLEAVIRFAEYLGRTPYSIDESQFDSVKFYVEGDAKDMFVIGKVPNLFPIGISWFEDFLALLCLEPDATQIMLDHYTDRALKIAERYIAIGVDCILVSGDWAYNKGPFVSPNHVRRFFVPQIKAVADLCHKHNVYLMKHTDGNIMKIADDFFNMGIDAFQAIEPHAGMSLSLLKKQYGSRITLMGNVDCAQILQYGSPQDVVEETKRCIREGAPGGGYILSSSNSIHSMIPARNFLVMLETARKFGRYPIVL